MTTFNPELVGEDNPELTRADFAAMIPAVKFFADRGLPMPRKRVPFSKLSSFLKDAQIKAEKYKNISSIIECNKKTALQL